MSYFRVLIALAVLFLSSVAIGQQQQQKAPARNYRAMSLAELKTFAEQNIPEAQIELASRYDAGRGVSRDSIEATGWYRKAAAGGNPDATMTLANRLAEGTGAEQSEALALFKKLAEQGNTRAMCELGICYRDGRGTFAVPADAISWFTKAADAGDPEGAFQLGQCHRTGVGAPADLAKAAEMYRRAADKGHGGAASALGDMYRKGEGVQKDPKQAISYYTRASQKNNADAQWALAQMYRYGEGVPADKEKAIALMKKLIAAKHPEALAALAQLNPEALKQNSKPLTFIGSVPDERLIGSLVRAEGTMKAEAGGKWSILARGLGGRPVALDLIPPPNAPAPGSTETPEAKPRSSGNTTPRSNNQNPRNQRQQVGMRQLTREESAQAAKKSDANADVTNWSRVKDNMPVTLWGTVNEKREFQCLMVKLTPPSIKWDYQLGETAGIKAGERQEYTIEGTIRNTGKTPLKNLKLRVHLYQESSPNDATGDYVIEAIAPGETVEFTITASMHNYSYAGGTSKPKVEIEVLGYDW